MNGERRPVLVLGAGIHGAAVARELLLNGVPVTIVDAADVSSGTTAFSSRLIHGGLRYLEFGELDLVRQSLQERTILLRQAPHLVRPLPLFIPVDCRAGGLFDTTLRLVGTSRRRAGPRTSRGLWLVRTGLWLYDMYARTSGLPRHRIHRIGARGVPQVDGGRYRWLCSYYDGQVAYPELLTVALLEDARRIAAHVGAALQVYTYHSATRSGPTVHLRPADISGCSAGGSQASAPVAVHPAAIVNATGAWVDQTLAQIGVPTRRLVAGTRGSHLLTFSDRLRQSLQGSGVYVEAEDRRPVFFLPFCRGTLVGTTDVPFHGDPRTAVATEEEIDYLLRAVNEVFPQVKLARGDIHLTYAGIRPLPVAEDAAPSAITRRHRLEEHRGADLPLVSLIGGKITTGRLVAEEITAKVLAHLGQPVVANSRQRLLPGGEADFLRRSDLEGQQSQIAKRHGISAAQVRAMWSLIGARTEGVLVSLTQCRQIPAHELRENVPHTDLPRAFVRWVIRNQWVTTVSDLVERRLMLVFDPGLSRLSLETLGDLMARERGLSAAQLRLQLEHCCDRLLTHFGKSIHDEPCG